MRIHLKRRLPVVGYLIQVFMWKDHMEMYAFILIQQ